MATSIFDKLKETAKKALQTDFSNAGGDKSDAEVAATPNSQLTPAEIKRKQRVLRDRLK